MKLSFGVIALSLMVAACASTPKPAEKRAPASVDCSQLTTQKKVWDANDLQLKCGDLTVEKLQAMALTAQQTGDWGPLNNLFNHGLNMSSLPIGYSAGKGIPFPILKNEALNKALEALTADHWRGKIFFDSGDPTQSHGLNRISPLYLLGPFRHYTPMAAFQTYLLTPDDAKGIFTQPQLATGITSNYVVLNYALPKEKMGDPAIDKARDPAVETVLTLNYPAGAPVFDVMVAVPGKYGPVYVGKTWLGKYDLHQKGHPFTARNVDQLIAWYFLDFNQGALDAQMGNDWSTETALSEAAIHERKTPL